MNVFISYSWDGQEHEKWVLSLADVIDKNGGNSIIDRKLKFGSHLRLFMERNIKAADVVLMVLTPKYKSKAENLRGGVGFEYNIITKELFAVIESNEKYIGVLRYGDHNSSVPNFIEDFKYVDLRAGSNYNDNLGNLIKQIFKSPLKNPDMNKENKEIEETDYRDLSLLIPEMKVKASDYIIKVFGAEGPFQKLKPKSIISDWEKEIERYHTLLVSKFNPKKMQIAEDYMEDFKNNIFGKDLWTVNAALRTHDPDLAPYKKNFKVASEEEIYSTVNGILNATHDYIKNVGSSLNYGAAKDVDELGLQYLNEEEMFMNKIIGYGIRSELLHRYYPGNLSIMTQKSLWAMYFLCDNSKEFITIEQKTRKGIMRVSHNWQYPYDRFTFIMNELAKHLESALSKFETPMLPQYRFGYVNMFLAAIHELHKADIRLLHEWVEME